MPPPPSPYPTNTQTHTALAGRRSRVNAEYREVVERRVYTGARAGLGPAAVAAGEVLLAERGRECACADAARSDRGLRASGAGRTCRRLPARAAPTPPLAASPCPRLAARDSQGRQSV